MPSFPAIEVRIGLVRQLENFVAKTVAFSRAHLCDCVLQPADSSASSTRNVQLHLFTSHVKRYHGNRIDR